MRKGIGAGGAIFLIIVFALIIYLGWNFGMVWFNSRWMKGKVRDAIQTRFMESSSSIISEIKAVAVERGIIIDENKVIVDRPSRDSIRVRLEYTDEVKVPGYQKTYNIKIEVTEAVGGGG